jgi:hypothetical protein
MVALLGLVTGAAACSSGGGSKAHSPVTPTSARASVVAADPCALVTQADATRFFGAPALKNPALKQANECAWTTSLTVPRKDMYVTLENQPVYYAPYNNGRALDGAGYKASISNQGDRLSFLALKGTNVLGINYSESLADTQPADPTPKTDALIVLGKSAVDRMP